MAETGDTPFTPYTIQRALGVTVDGRWGQETERAALLFLGNPKDNTGRPWTRKRLVLGVQQKLMADAGIKVEIDGLPGLETFVAFDKWRALASDPAFDVNDDGKKDHTDAAKLEVVEAAMIDLKLIKRFWDWMRRAEPAEAPAPVVIAPAKPAKPATSTKPAEPAVPPKLQPTVWPRQKDVETFYGPHGNVPLVKVKCPWQLELSWEPQTKVSSIAIHAKLAKSLESVLSAQLAHYGEDGLRKLGVHKYGGSFNDRKMRGNNAWSMHSYGCAIDFDPDNNQLKWSHERARLAQPDAEAWWSIWESAGWVSLGRERDFDWMHCQAARL